MLVQCETGPYVIWAKHGENPYLDEVSWTVILDEVTLEWVGEVEARPRLGGCSTWYRGNPDGQSCALEGIDRISEMVPECNLYRQCDYCDCIVNTVNDFAPPECGESADGSE